MDSNGAKPFCVGRCGHARARRLLGAVVDSLLTNQRVEGKRRKRGLGGKESGKRGGSWTYHSNRVVDCVTLAAVVPPLVVDVVDAARQEELDLGIGGNVFGCKRRREVVLHRLRRRIYRSASKSIVQRLDLEQHVLQRHLALRVVVDLDEPSPAADGGTKRGRGRMGVGDGARTHVSSGI